MFTAINGETANDVWEKALKELKKETAFHVESRSGITSELLHTLLSISNPRERWVSIRVPQLSIAFALAEIVWIINGSNDAKIINYWNPSLKQFAGIGDQYHGAYGFRLRKNLGIDQLDRAFLSLKNNPNNRQTVLLIWDPLKDLPDTNGQPTSEDIPCNICSLLKIRENKLEWTQIMRSNDIFRGLPYNIVQFTSLQEIMAGWLEVEVGSYTHFSDSLHLYNDDQKISFGDNKFFSNGDILSIGKEESEEVFCEIFNKMKVMSSVSMTAKELLEISNLDFDNDAYKNIVYILVAYVSKRQGYEELKNDLVGRCTNRAYRQMWYQWENR